MKIFNCHTHSCFSHDGRGTVEEICKEAIKNNLLGFALTDHCDCEYSQDVSIPEKLSLSFSESKKLQTLYKENLIISCGVEIGEAIYNPAFAKRIIDSHSWDVILGSVHAVRIDKLAMPFSTIDFSDFNDLLIDKYISQYFKDMYEMLVTQDFDILSHLTVVLRYIAYKYKKNVNIKAYYPIITEILKKAIELGKCLEINTSGLSDGFIMPDTDILKIYKELGGKNISIGSDSHSPEMLTNGLSDCVEIIKNAGFDKLTYFIDRKPITYDI